MRTHTNNTVRKPYRHTGAYILTYRPGHASAIQGRADKGRAGKGIQNIQAYGHKGIREYGHTHIHTYIHIYIHIYIYYTHT